MTDKRLKTIDEVNAEREASPVMSACFTIKPEWRPTGIESPFGGELLSLDPQPAGINQSMEERVKCSKTGKEGYLELDGSVRSVIMGLRWDK